MKSLKLSRRALTMAIGAILLASTVSAVAKTPTTAPAPVKALLTFGDPSHIEHAGDLLNGRKAGRIVSGGSLPADQLRRYALPSAGAVAIIAARDIASLGDSRAALMKLFNAGVPVFVCADDAHRADVAGLFGMSPEAGDAMFVRQKDGEVAVLGNASGERHWTPRWSKKMAASVGSLRDAGAQGGHVTVNALDDFTTNEAEQGAAAPIYTFHDGLIETGTDEITGRATIQVIRSASRNGDDKEISVRAWSTITPERVGLDYSDYREVLKNYKLPFITTATLPWVYRTSHKVLADGVKPQLAHSLPDSNGSTNVDYEKIERRGYTIGGGMGANVSASGRPSAALAAKLRFNLSFSYTNEKTETIRYSFVDYSMFARPVDGGTRMLWEAPIAPHLKDALIADKKKKTFTDGKNMTPMMFSGSLDTWSVWKVPGEYEGKVTVEVAAGYDRNERLRSLVKPRVGYFEETKPISASKRYVLDLSHPFLTKEITVLIRSAAGDGGCLAQVGGAISLAPCDPSSRLQMWGLDSEARYINRATKQCLTADTEVAALRMNPCTLANSQRWEWRADRLHSGYDDGRHRLYVELGKVRFHVPPGRFEDVPVNPHNAVLSPWSGYPKAPLANELIPAPHNVDAGSVPSSWASNYGAIGPDQRWDVIVLRAGLAPNL
jgi:hemolysin